MKARQLREALQLGMFSLAALIVAAPTFASSAQIVTVTPGGVGYVQTSSGTNGVGADIGRWDTAYPNPDTGERAPGLEPSGASTLAVGIDVNDGGTVSFSYQFLSYDAGIYDWFDVYMITPSGAVSLISHLGKPGADYGTYWESAHIALSQSLNNWRNQHVTFVFSVQQDGWGDQSTARLYDFAVRTCPVPPLAELTDSEALSFEAGNTLNTSKLNAAMQVALTCLLQQTSAVAGTLTVTSAYRPVAYQQHLREVWDRWNDLRNLRDPDCEGLRALVQAEFIKHGLLLSQRPAASSAHTRGEAFDARWTLPFGKNIDTLAALCNLVRPLATDPVHFIHR